MATISSFDFNGYYDYAIEALKVQSEHSNILYESGQSKLLIVICQLLAYMTQENEMLSTENQWKLAQNISSLLTNAPILSYKINWKIGATGMLRVSNSKTLDHAYPSDISIPAYTTFLAGKTYYSTVDSFILSSSNDYIDIPVVQGIPLSETFTADGSGSEKFLISNGNIENSNYLLTVNGVLWTEIDTLFEAEGSFENYELSYNSSLDTLSITFGDGNYGKQLTDGDIIVFNYLETEGLSGNVQSLNFVNKVKSVIYTTIGDIVNLYCTNIEAISGGADYPDIEQIRVTAPKFFQTGDRASSPQDYQTLVEALSYVQKASIWGAKEYNEDLDLDPWTFIPSEENLVHLVAINSDGETATTTQQNQILEDINDRKGPTDLLSFETAQIVLMNFLTTARAQSKTYTETEIRSNIQDALVEEYSLSNRDFYESLAESDYKSLIDGITGVKSHSTVLQFEKYTVLQAPYLFDIALNICPVQGDTMEVYIKLDTDLEYTKIATGLASGGFSSEVGYDISDSFIEPTTGQGAIIISSGLAEEYTRYSVKILYQSSSLDVNLQHRYDILKYNSSTIQVVF